MPSDQTNAYDANGNRTNTGYVVDPNNETKSDGAFNYLYDNEGNRTQRTEITSGAVTEYQWDYRNRLTRVTNKDSVGAITQVVEYTYDVFNRRIEKAVDVTSPFDLQDAALESYIYDDASGVSSDAGGNVILDFVDADGPAGPASSALSTRRLFGNAVDQILAEENVSELITSPSRISWPLVDNLGTVRDIARNDSTLATHFTYDAFGQVLTGDTSLTRYLYTSREFDAATGLTYYRARWYATSLGQFISEDPLSFAAGDTNIVRYVGNGPTNATDPSGLEGFGRWEGYGKLLEWLPDSGIEAFDKWVDGEANWLNKQRPFPISRQLRKSKITSLYMRPDPNYKKKFASGNLEYSMSNAEKMDLFEAWMVDVAFIMGGVGVCPLRSTPRTVPRSVGRTTSGSLQRPAPPSFRRTVGTPPQMGRTPVGSSQGFGRVFTSLDRHVGTTATKLDAVFPGRVQSVNTHLPANVAGSTREVDIVMDQFVIQVKSGKAKGLAAQIKETCATLTNNSRRVIGYAPDQYSNRAWKGAADEGIPIARSFDELVAIIKELSN